MTAKRVCVIVLGDFERSPRMKYHTQSLTKLDYDIDIVAYLDTPVSAEILTNSKIHFYPIKNYSSYVYGLPRLFGYFYKTLALAASLLFTLLFSIKKPTFFLVQNPPSLPTLPVVYFVSLIRGVKPVIDWHNYGYTILALSLGRCHPLVWLCRWCEGFFGSRCDYNFCVSKALAQDLKRQWDISAKVLYDRPPPIFAPLDVQQKCLFMSKLAQLYPEFRSDDGSGNRYFHKVDGTYREREDRPLLIVSSTSWTEDEDFSMLLKALEDYDDMSNPSLPRIMCVITGKGPQKDFYKKIVERKDWQKVKIVMPWLTSEDYSKMVGSADLGVSLHTSSSNLDLPMKIVDMFGCAVPALSVKYTTLSELIKENRNGMMFENSAELLQLFLILFKTPRNKLNMMRSYLERQAAQFTWDLEWNRTAATLFR